MNRSKFFVACITAGLIGAAGYGVYSWGMAQGMKMSAQATTPSAGERKVLYWHDPMVPGQKFDKPGKSPFMDMQLVPVYADDGGNDSAVNISARVQQNLGIRTAAVTAGSLEAPVTAVGTVAYNDRDVALVQARSNGFVEKLHVRTVLDPVKKGQPLAQLYVPEWIAAQEEYLSLARMANTAGLDALRDGAKQRMRLVGMNDDQIRAVATSGKVLQRITLTAPVSGIVSELSIREGATVMSGAALFKINGLDTVWVNAEIPENIAAQVQPGNAVEARTPSLADAVFRGKVSAILPEVDAATRTLTARIELANPRNALVPGMFATVSFRPERRRPVLLIPSEAVIQTGTRSVVMVDAGGGKFSPVEVETGSEGGGMTEIRKGLDAGQKVVTSGQFLIDSEASLRGATARMEGMPPSAGPVVHDKGDTSQPAAHHGQGTIEKMEPDEITISHGPIPDLQWGPMTMGFKPPRAGLPNKLGVGDKVDFAIRAMPDGQYAITTISAAAGASTSDIKPAKPGAAK